MKTLRRFLTSGLIWLVFASQLRAGTVTGAIQNPSGGPTANATITFQLNQSAVISGTATLVTGPVSCFTDASGNVVNEPNPFVAPVVSQNLSSGTLGAGTYFVKLTYVDATGQTVASPETSFTLGGTGTLIVTAPVRQPANVTSYKVYISTSSGTETLQGSVTVSPGSWGNYSQSSALAAGAALPSSNTTVCTIHFNDEMQPSFVCYDVGLTSQLGATIPGYPQYWYLAGGSAGTVNISIGTPQSTICQGAGVVYPQAILSQPAGNGSQSINGPLNLGTFGLTAGSVTSQNDNGILNVETGGYANIAAAYTAAGLTNKTTIYVASAPNYTGTDCPVAQANIIVHDFRGTTICNNVNEIQYFINDGVVNAMVKEQAIFTGTLNLNGSAVARWTITNCNNCTANNAVFDGFAPEAVLLGTLTGTMPILSGVESAAAIRSTGGTVTIAYGIQGYINDLVGRTTAITNGIGVGGIGCNGLLGTPKPVNCFGGEFFSQTNQASAYNYALAWVGQGIARYDSFFGGAFLDYEDSTGNTAHHILWSNGTDIILQAMGANGVEVADSSGALHYKLSPTAFTPATAGSQTVGSALLPFSDFFGGTAATNNFDLNFSATAGARTVKFPDFGASSGVTNANFPATVVLHTAYTNATTSFTTVSDGTRSVAFPVAASTDYKIVCDFVYQASAATAGPKIEFTGPASPTQVSYDLVAYTSTTQAAGAPSDAATHGTSFGTSISSGTAIGSTAADLTMRVTANVVNGANAGTLTLLAAAQGVGTLTIQPGGSCRMQ